MDVSFFTAIFLLNLKVMIRTVIIKNLVCLSVCRHEKGSGLSRGFSFIIKNMNEQNYLIVSDNIGIIKYINIKI